MRAAQTAQTAPAAGPAQAGRRAGTAVPSGPLPAEPPRYSRRAVLAGYTIPVLAVAVAALTWFRPGRFVAAGDVAPYVRDNLAGEFTSLWNHQASGAGSTSYAITQVLDLVLLWLTGALGLSPVIAQYLLYAGCFGLAAFGGAFLAGAWTFRPAARAFAGLGAAFNIYLLVNCPNVLPALAIGLTGVMTGLVLRAGVGRTVPVWVLALPTLLSSYLAQNPPLLLVTVMTVLMAAVAADLLMAPGASWRALALLVRAVPLMVLLNLWWIAPYLVTLLHGEGLTMTAQTDVGAWAWTQVRASVRNVATLNAHWGWGHIEYFPYRTGMEAPAWRMLRWALPVLALTGAILADRPRRRAAAVIAAACPLLIWLGKGIHPPCGWINMWLYDHVPGLWLLRDPANKLTVVLVLAYTTLAAIAIDRLRTLAGRHPRRLGSGRRPRRVGYGLALAAAAAIAGAAIIYPWPLWTGTVVAGNSEGSGRTRIPHAWYQVASAVNAAPGQGKALVLPLDPYYQVSTAWEYHGVDTVPAQLIHRPVLQQLPGGYFGSLVNGSLSALESQLLSGAESARIDRLLRSLGVSQIIVRHDLRDDMDLPTADSHAISAALNRLATVRSAGRFGVADLYRVPSVTGQVNADRELVAVTGDGAGQPTDTYGLPPDVAVTDAAHAGGDAGGRRITVLTDGNRFRVSRPGGYRLISEPIPRLAMRARVEHDSGGAALVLGDAYQFSVDGHPLPGRPAARLRLPAAAQAVALGRDGVPQPVPPEGLLIPARAGETIQAYDAEDALPGRFGSLEDCHDTDKRTLDQAGLAVTHLGPRSVRLTALTHAACVSVPVRGHASTYRVHFAYRSPTGQQPRFCLWEHGPDRCAAWPAPELSRDWREYERWAHVDPGTRKLSLYVFADGPGDHRGTVEYRDVGVDAVRSLGTVRLTDADAPPMTVPLAAGWHTIGMNPRPQASGLAPYSALQDCNDEIGFNGIIGRISVRRTGGQGIELAASADTACVSAPVSGPVSDSYRLTLDYRTLAGLPARVCVWEVGPDTCAKLPDLVPSRRWRTLSAIFHPDPHTRELQLYLYADGQDHPRTVTQYRGISLARVDPVTVSVEPAVTPPSAPGLTVHTEDLTHRQVGVHGANGTFVLTLAESYAPGWRLQGLPRGWHARHLLVDGYANGWVVTGDGDARLRLVYAPAQWTKPALPLSAIALMILSLRLIAPLAKRVGATPLRERGSRLVGAGPWTRAGGAS